MVAGGGGTGMGASVARIVGELGGEVHVLDLREPSAPAASFSRTDLGDPASIAEAVEQIGGPVHALFNCQGVSGRAPGTLSIDVLRVNFLGVRHLTELVLHVADQLARPHLAAEGPADQQHRVQDVVERALIRAQDRHAGADQVADDVALEIGEG